uniref:DUF4393 domain-containing protein n=1 Tax=Caenorhabditis tropicalis TaxID=1561998 RepID=A0A1I7TSA7_9PELO
MSLFEPTENGLLGTHVLWNDIEEAMQNAFGTDSHFGPNRKVTNIGDMKGFLSRLALIEPDWVSSNIHSIKLPDKFVVKIASQLSLIEIARMTKNTILEKEKIPQMRDITKTFHNREIEIYKIIEKENNPKIIHPKMYTFKYLNDLTDLKAFIVSEYIPNVYISMHESISAENLIPVLKTLAAFSALGEKIPKSELSFVSKTSLWTDVLKDIKDDEVCEAVYFSANLKTFRAFNDRHLF